MSMVHVCVLGENRQYSEDTLLKDVAKEVQESFSHEILLATVDGKLQELHKKVKEGTSVEFLTAADKPGIQTYRRSVLLILLKAFYEVIGAEHILAARGKEPGGSGIPQPPRHVLHRI